MKPHEQLPATQMLDDTVIFVIVGGFTRVPAVIVWQQFGSGCVHFSIVNADFQGCIVFILSHRAKYSHDSESCELAECIFESAELMAIYPVYPIHRTKR